MMSLFLLLLGSFTLMLFYERGMSMIWHWLTFSIFFSCFCMIPDVLHGYKIFIVGNFFLDSVSSFMVFLSLWMTSLMLMCSYKVLIYKFRYPTFLFCLVSLLLVLIISFCMTTMIGFYMFFEFSLIPTLFLILGWGYQPERLQAGMYMVMYTVGASLPLLVCIFFVYNCTGSTSFFLPWMWDEASNFKFLLAFFMVLAFFVKLPVYFFHLWLPKAHVEAPVSGSMILAGVLLKLGGYGLIRVVPKIFSSISFFSDFFVCFSLWGGILTSLICLIQVDMKSLIAYSSIGHMSLIIIGVFSGSLLGLCGALIIMISHGFCSPALFSLANYSYEYSGSRGVLMNKGMMHVSPCLVIWWFFFCIFNMAAPPSLNLIGELMIFMVSYSYSGYIFLFIGLMSFLAGCYSLYLYTSITHGPVLVSYYPFFSFKFNVILSLLLHLFPLVFMVFSLNYFFFF